MNGLVLAVFGLVYLGMVLGRLPGLALDRSGVALLGAIVLVAAGRLPMGQLGQAVDMPTLALLFGLMIVSAQFRLGGFYSWVVRRLAGFRHSPQALLAQIVAVSGLLSSLLANDIVCLAMTPVLVELCARRGLNPLPFLLGLACAANVGSAATLIGNPQNMLIGQVLGLSFPGYLADALAPTAAGLAVVWLVVAWCFRGRWLAATPVPALETPPFDLWQTVKGAVVLAGLVAAFLFSPWPREASALAGAGLLLCSRHMRTSRVLGLVDWPLLVLFTGLFVVNYCLAQSGLLARLTGGLAAQGVDLAQPAWLFGVCAVLSNLVSNVPAVMLLLPAAANSGAGAVLALSSTLAGNLLIVGSIANIIVVDQAARLGVRVSWAQHARVGVPVTLITLGLAAGWLWLRWPV
ncbi:MAG: anion transporter [Proteobacteria bacterium]|nr:anion transporter [Pseudomonadota bacterium]MBU1449607.1 anion transporter [Pseudomonadota bacterium]MBU2469726.1 anion transporter [Pseudomonadota bacterium]MBU2517320.1 anion transporter [Pseudomonadota bacterium]